MEFPCTFQEDNNSRITLMTYKEETFVLDSLIEIIEHIRSPEYKQLIKETHENNIMLKQIIKVINTHLAHHNTENDNDFMRNVMANLISSGFEVNKLFKR